MCGLRTVVNHRRLVRALAITADLFLAATVWTMASVTARYGEAALLRSWGWVSSRVVLNAVMLSGVVILAGGAFDHVYGRAADPAFDRIGRTASCFATVLAIIRALTPHAVPMEDIYAESHLLGSVVAALVLVTLVYWFVARASVPLRIWVGLSVIALGAMLTRFLKAWI